MSEPKAEYVVSRAVVPDLPGIELAALPDAPESGSDQPAGVPGETNPTVEKAKQLLRSRKFWAAMVGLGMVVLKAYKPDFPISEEQVSNLVYVLMAYILGTALEDGLTKSSQSSVNS